MAQVVYVLGAGFNCSILRPWPGGTSRCSPPPTAIDGHAFPHLQAPLARNFFQAFLATGPFKKSLDFIGPRLFVNALLEEIEHYWKLDLHKLETAPFDIEECLTLFESQLNDEQDGDRKLHLLRVEFALRILLLMYLSELSALGDTFTPTAQRFGQDVLESSADVLTFNHDTLAEATIEGASGFGRRPNRNVAGWFENPIPYEDLDASHHAWKRTLAYGHEFDEVYLPVAGTTRYIEGSRYYQHPANKLYEHSRVLKLHGSIDWLRYTPKRVYPSEFSPPPEQPPNGIVLDRFTNYRMGPWQLPDRNGWLMEPVVIPPQLYKQYDEAPFPPVWQHALETLSTCEKLVVVGYSFPPTDFRTRRLFLEAFSDNSLSDLIVVNPDPSVVNAARTLTHYGGDVVHEDDLPSLYDLPPSFFNVAGDEQASG